MKTILHMIETSGPGGAENVLINISAHIDKSRFRSIVCLRKEGWLRDQLERKNIPTYVIQENGFVDPRFAIELLRVVRRERVALIHSHEFLMSFYGSVIGKILKRPVLSTFHGKNYYPEKKRRRLLVAFISRNSEMVCVSNELAQFLKSRIGIKAMPRTIYNGIDLATCSATCGKEDLKEQLGIRKDSRIVGTVGNLYPVKGQVYLIRAIPRVIRENPNVVFVFAGRGGEEERLRQEARNLNVSDRVFLLGFRSDIFALLEILDVFVLPSLSECLPVAVLEAMAKRIPPVVTDVGGNREIIDDQINGFIVPPGREEALAERITYLLRNGEVAKEIGAKAFQTVRERFTLEKMVAKYEELYDSLLLNRRNYNIRD
ncbi:MAG: glycosyltransferase [Deltaproteobacteria bacterium]